MKHLLIASMTALVLAMPVPAALAATPDDQLVIGLSMSNILTLDPAAIAGRESTAVVTNVYDTPIQLDAVERTQVNPGLAESWDISEDGSTVTLNFREGATFASGNPVTVEDALWSWKRILELELVGSAAWQAYGFTLDNFRRECHAGDGDAPGQHADDGGGRPAGLPEVRGGAARRVLHWTAGRTSWVRTGGAARA